MLDTTRIRTCKHCGADSQSVRFYNGVGSRCAECHKRLIRENRHMNIEYYRSYDAKRYQDQPQRRAANEAYAKTDRGKEVMRATRKKWIALNQVKRNAHNRVNNAVKNGAISKPDCCMICGNSARRIHGHHEDYSKPLEVIWVCPPCHRGLHK